MNKHLVNVFVAIIDNKIVCYETNLKAFQKKFSLIEAGVCNYQALYRRFLKNDYLEFTLSDKTYYFQKLV